MLSLPTRVSWWLTATSALWVGALVVLEWPTRGWLGVCLAVWFGAATWIVTRWPWPGVILTAVGILALGLIGLPSENGAPLGPVMIALVSAGYLLSPRVSVWTIPVLLAATATSAERNLPSMLFGSLLLVLPWWFGVLVRGRDTRRRRAAEDARRLASVDPSAQARRAAVAEREQVAAAAFEVIGDAVRRMTRAAADARASLEPTAIEAIHRDGEAATHRLRALLVLLRAETPASETAVPEPNAEESEPISDAAAGSRGWMRTLLGAWPAVLVMLDVWLVPVQMTTFGAVDEPSWPSVPFLLFVVLPMLAVLVLRDRFIVAALLVTAGLIMIATTVGLVDLGRDGLWLAIAGAALSWSAGRAGTRRASAAWLVFAVTILTLIAVNTPDNLPIQLALIVLPFGAAAAWSGHLAAEAAHLGEAQVRLAQIEAAERAAVSNERLQLSRDLHDAASHAVGTMMMQANAARVLRERDPDAARAALDAIIDIGRESADELRTITTTTRADAAYRTTLPEHGPDDTVHLADEIDPMLTAARRAGAQVTTDLDVSVDPSPDDVRLLVRVVREGLANAVRHAPGSDVHVEVQVTRALASVTITNGPARPDPRHDHAAASPTFGSGLGLRGLRELIDERPSERPGDRPGELTTRETDSGYVLSAHFTPRHAVNHPVHPAVKPAVVP